MRPTTRSLTLTATGVLAGLALAAPAQAAPGWSPNDVFGYFATAAACEARILAGDAIGIWGAPSCRPALHRSRRMFALVVEHDGARRPLGPQRPGHPGGPER